MTALSAAAVLTLWEQGQALHPIDRAVLLLKAAWTEAAWQELASWTIGRRNDSLLRLCAEQFGPELGCFARCPHCEASVEFDVSAEALLGEAPDEEEVEVEDGGLRVLFRLPTSLDLAAAVGESDLAAARRLVLHRCSSEISGRERPLETIAEPFVSSLPSERVEAICRQLIEHDPRAESTFALECPECGRGWNALFDISDYLWTAIERQARRIAREVRILARAYGWSEAEILHMSPERRSLYLELEPLS